MRPVWMVFLLALAAAPGAVAAQSPFVEEVRFGVLAQSCCGFGANKEDGVGINAEAVFKSPKFLSILAAPRPVVGFTASTDRGATSEFYAGFEWRYDLSDRFFVSTMLGGAIHNGETDPFDPVADAGRADTTLFMGCRAHFRYAVDGGVWLTDRISASIYWSHISNAGLCSENEGLDHLGARIGYRF